jgi:hypothetical protein
VDFECPSCPGVPWSSVSPPSTLHSHAPAAGPCTCCSSVSSSFRCVCGLPSAPQSYFKCYSSPPHHLAKPQTSSAPLPSWTYFSLQHSAACNILHILLFNFFLKWCIKFYNSKRQAFLFFVNSKVIAPSPEECLTLNKCLHGCMEKQMIWTTIKK